MGQFSSAEEVHRYIGQVFLEGGAHPDVGPKLRAANITLQLNYSDPDGTMVVSLREPIEVFEGPGHGPADVELTLPADTAHRFWCGEYNLAVGLAKREVQAKGPVNKILKLVPLTKPLFPIYRGLWQESDAAAGSAV